MKNKLTWLLCYLSLMLLPILASAKEIIMYDQPSNNAKPIGKIDLSVGIIPIYLHPQKQWVRVGDPRNGNVGWVRTSEVNDNDNSTVVTQQIIKDGKGPSSYQSVEIGNPARVMSQEEIQAQMREWQKQQQNVQQIQQQVYRNLLDKIHELNDPSGTRYEMIEEIGRTVPSMFPTLIPTPQKPPAKLIPQKMPQLKNETTERTDGMPARSPKPGYSLERPAIENTEPVAGAPATQPTPGIPSTEPTPGIKPAGPSRD